ncbi:MAG TPA: thiamine phosphate synthase [Candidatus Gallacutalibacter stercoravium]|nr:thiamine phosphate synthase [Candidatus Gallacutalibacter stercoravium]
MKFDRDSLLLYAVTDSSWLKGGTLEEAVRQAVSGGATCVQLREKHLPPQQLEELARRVKQVTDAYGVPLIINDSVSIARAVDAAGVHIGQEDCSVQEARRILGPDKVIGVSARSVQQAQLAQSQGANYLGVGAVFGTTTKADAKPLSRQMLREITQSVTIPAVAIGGINECNVKELACCGIAGVAVVSALFAQPDIVAAAHNLHQLAEGIVK